MDTEYHLKSACTFYSGEDLLLDSQFECLNCLIQLDQESFPFPWNREEWVGFLKNHLDSGIVLLKDESHKKGIGFSLWDINRVDSFAHLLKLGVDPIKRNKGHGSQVMSESLLNLKANNFKHFYLEVSKINHAAIDTYLKFGFKKIHEKKQFYSNGEDALVMTLDV